MRNTLKRQAKIYKRSTVFLRLSRGNGFLHHYDERERIDGIILLILPVRAGDGRAAVRQPIITE